MPCLKSFLAFGYELILLPCKNNFIDCAFLKWYLYPINVVRGVLEKRSNKKKEMANDAEKLEVISGYYKLLEEDIRRRLDRIKQSEGAGRSLLPLGYSQILDHIYEIHLKFEKEKYNQCAKYKEIIEKIKAHTQNECFEEIKSFLLNNIGGIKRTGTEDDKLL